MNTSQHRLVYTIDETAAMLGVGRSTAYELIRTGDITSIRIGKRRFVTRLTLEEILGFRPPSPAELHP